MKNFTYTIDLKKLLLLNLIAFSLLSVTTASNAAETYITGHVTMIDATWMPAQFSFLLDSGDSVCPLTTWVKWASSDFSNNKAVYATLVTALVSGKKVDFHHDDADTSCKGSHLILRND